VHSIPFALSIFGEQSIFSDSRSFDTKKMLSNALFITFHPARGLFSQLFNKRAKERTRSSALLSGRGFPAKLLLEEPSDAAF
jgi:hypothetical protein